MSLLSKLGRKGSRPSDRTAAPAAAPAPLGPAEAADKGTAALMIACPDPTQEDLARDAYRLRGQFLARQDRWNRLSAEMRAADEGLFSTPAALSVAELLCFGARSDVVAAIEHALIDGKPAKGAPLMAGIEALEEMLAEVPDDPYRAITVAHAHIDSGWAWRGNAWESQVPKRNYDAFAAHFDRARDILRPLAAKCANSPLYQAATCALHGAGLIPGTRLAREYERLIDLNPKNPASLRALGTYISPRWFGSHAELELEARRTAARTHEVWGTGGYTWVMLDALAGDPLACENLDTDFFVEGLADILVRMDDQHTTNTLAAFCAFTIGAHRTGHPKADAVRKRIADCAHWIVRNHMTEVHPLIWAHAASGFDNTLRVPSPRRFAAAGQRHALRAIATLFQREIAQGQRIIFTAEGPVAEHC